MKIFILFTCISNIYVLFLGASDQIDVVELHRDASGSLGLSISGGISSPLGDVPVMVANITPNGPAALSQKLMVSIHIISTVFILKAEWFSIKHI